MIWDNLQKSFARYKSQKATYQCCWINMYEMLERNKSIQSNIVRHNVRHWPPKDSLEIALTLEWYFVVDFEVVFWFYLCLYFLFSIIWIIWSRYSKTLIQKVHLTSLLVHINHHIMINLKVSRLDTPWSEIRGPSQLSLWIIHVLGSRRWNLKFREKHFWNPIRIIRIPNFCYIQVIVFDLSYLPVAAVGT